jgi:predicted kinase
MSDNDLVVSAPVPQVVHVLVGPRASGKTTWVDQNQKQECYGFSAQSLRALSRSGCPLGCVAISSTQPDDIASSDDALSLKATMFVLDALEHFHVGSFTVEVLRFQRNAVV